MWADKDHEHWFFNGRQRGSDGAGDMVAIVDDLGACYAADLRRVMRATEAADMGGEQLLLCDVEEQYFDELQPVAPVSFQLRDGALLLRVQNYVEGDESRALEQAIARVVQPYLNRHRMWIESLSVDDVGPGALWDLAVGFHAQGRVLADLYGSGTDLVELVGAMVTGDLTRSTICDLVRGGHAQLLIGQPEGHWLEAKSQHYDLRTEGGQISLAQAVTRFCNAEQCGVVVVGLKTRRVPGGETIHALSPMPADPLALRRYQQALDRRVFPPPDNLSVEVVPTVGGTLILIDIPPQPEELKPFLVHGAIVGGRAEGAFISIVRRRGEASIPITAPMIHSSLAAGRALLRRGVLPPESGQSEPTP
ncbi:hypothetical protein [Cellulomonas fimi]|uniref:Uncharacterized protein n=1 Tax=Cellulomonas fimi TaxID=1708 RepID=A0A7Y0QHY0_CELFI|nr:hypothetical protein [Cellulomonas fimi]NMR21661.1 hypothetical protein [Cellulomonas fimi]